MEARSAGTRRRLGTLRVRRGGESVGARTTEEEERVDTQVADQFKERQRAVWDAGNFDEIAKMIRSVGEGIAELAGIGPEDTVLDVACGTGNATLPAARRGATVTGLDLTPKLLQEAQAYAEAEGLEIEWVEGDAEALPFEDASFDVVISTFGCMFAPRHEVAAQEIARVLRPGGRIGICSWTPTGRIGGFFQVTARHLPPPPEGSVPPPMWGVPDHVSELFAGTGVEPRFEQRTVDMVFDSPEAAVEKYATQFGPVVMAKAMLEPQGRWGAMADDLLAYFREQSEPRGDGVVAVAEYLAVTGTKAS
jgi:ubiquinone/menaquinone biosynthesis C-methylase UbiE